MSQGSISSCILLSLDVVIEKSVSCIAVSPYVIFLNSPVPWRSDWTVCILHHPVSFCNILVLSCFMYRGSGVSVFLCRNVSWCKHPVSPLMYGASGVHFFFYRPAFWHIMIQESISSSIASPSDTPWFRSQFLLLSNGLLTHHDSRVNFFFYRPAIWHITIQESVSSSIALPSDTPWFRTQFLLLSPCHLTHCDSGIKVLYRPVSSPIMIRESMLSYIAMSPDVLQLII